MRFRVTSAAGSQEGAWLSDVTVNLEDQLNSELGTLEFGSGIGQFTMVVVSVYDEPEPNEEWCRAHRKLATAKNPLTGEVVRYLSVAVPVAPSAVLAAKDAALLTALVAASAVTVLAERPARLPAGLDFARLSAAVTSALTRSTHGAV